MGYSPKQLAGIKPPYGGQSAVLLPIMKIPPTLLLLVSSASLSQHAVGNIPDVMQKVEAPAPKPGHNSPGGADSIPTSQSNER